MRQSNASTCKNEKLHPQRDRVFRRGKKSPMPYALPLINNVGINTFEIITTKTLSQHSK